MSTEQQQAILTIALLAAFADGDNDPLEREQIRRLAETLGGEQRAPDLPALYQRVLLKRVRLEDAAAVLTDPDQQHLAYETAVCVCDADGLTTEAERRFLDTLALALKLDSHDTERSDQQAAAMASAIDKPLPAATAIPAYVAGDTPSAATDPSIAVAEIDRSVLNYAILSGALELLPQNWAAMAIVPLQIKMVYSIGKSHGYDLDQGHIREFLATLGVGLTSQYLEQFGRKLLGGLLGQLAGGLGKQLGSAATGVAFSFATTYALGQVAKNYYAGGRQMSTALLQQSFQNLLGPAKEMQVKYLPQIQQRANSLDASQIMSMMKGGLSAHSAP